MGILGNETADFLAGEAMKRGEQSEYLVPHSDLYALVKKNLIESINSFLSLQSLYKGTSYFEQFGPFSLSPWFEGLDLGRAEIVTISRIRTNHYNLNYSLNRCNLVDSSACSCNCPVQDIDHVLWYCPLYASYRPELIKSLEKNLGSTAVPRCVLALLRNPSPCVIFPIMSFLRASGIDV